ncbi:DUF1015 domain-containing protein [Desulfotomaculum copahuensis]|uniref:DUF1015 domain-containing protein n=1 Tax=Desulfotomaculum copahuensis TaxID=1838280 RepID=UPI000AE99EB0|nr:DUF1015 domain-containing protein [Desulfotomaculum copahuensis]
MAKIFPFRGLRYTPAAGLLRDLVTPPYDVIDAAAQEKYYRRHLYNIIRLEYGRTGPEDTQTNNRYTRAAADFAAWQEKGVLAPEAVPALYRYEQEFTVAGHTRVRGGMICAVRLEPYENGVILPHEETLPKHKADRLALMQACAANFSPIFGLYADPEMNVEAMLRRAACREPDEDGVQRAHNEGRAAREAERAGRAAGLWPSSVGGAAPGTACSGRAGGGLPVSGGGHATPGKTGVHVPLRSACRAADLEFTDENEITHRLWVVAGQDAIKKIQNAMDGRRIFIADGHHRYETALQYSRLCRQAAGDPPGDLPTDYVMMTLVNLYDPGLVVLPTHRLVRNVADLDVDRLLRELGALFTVDEYPLDAAYRNFPQFLARLAEKAGLAGNTRAAAHGDGAREHGAGRMDFPAGGGTAAGRSGNLPGADFQPDPSHFRGPAGPAAVPVRNAPPPHRHVFGLYCGRGRLYTLALQDESALPGLMPPEHSPAWQGLDVAVLHQLILENLLGIGGRERAGESHLTYTREETGALDAVDNGEYQLAFFLNPTLVEEVTAVAGNGEKMPQKSTFFYPKLITGLVINKLS